MAEEKEFTQYPFWLLQSRIEQEARFDGFYAICTDLEDPAPDIIHVNGGRWIIENGFRIMKTDFTYSDLSVKAYKDGYEVSDIKKLSHPFHWIRHRPRLGLEKR